MKKKIFNVTLWGYYLVSIVLGIAMALTVSMMACDLWNFCFGRQIEMEEELELQYRRYGAELTAEEKAIWEEADIKSGKIENLWVFVPLNDVGNELSVWEYGSIHSYAPLVMMVSATVTIVLSVMIMEGKSANKAWRQKMIQAGAIAALIILMSVAYQCAEWRALGDLATWTVMVPTVLLIIPLLVLKKTRVRKEAIGNLAFNFGGMMPEMKAAVEVEKTE